MKTPHILKALAFALALPAFAAPVAGVGSGDTLTVIDNGKSVRIRLAYIDAPEPRQPYAQDSRRSLSTLCAGKDAKYETLYIDRSQQHIAIVHCGSVNASRHQVATGMAWVYDEYNRDESLPDLQKKARSQRLGIWKDRVVTPPWEYRRRGFSGRLDGRKSFSE